MNAPRGGPISILVGRFLKSDLKALRICHPLCIDTPLIHHRPAVDQSNPGSHSSPRNGLITRFRHTARADTTPKMTHVHAPTCFDPKSKTAPGSARKASLSACRRGAAGVARAVRSAFVDRGNPGVMHGFKATTAIACGSDREVLDDLIQAVSSHEFLFGRLTGIADILGCKCASLLCVSGLIFFDAGTDGRCTSRGVPSNRGVARSLRDCTSHAERTTHHALRVPFGAHRRGNIHRPLGSTPHGIAQKSLSRARICWWGCLNDGLS